MVPMKDSHTMVDLVSQERITNPAEVRLALERQTDIWSKSSMNEQVISKTNGIGNPGEERGVA